MSVLRRIPSIALTVALTFTAIGCVAGHHITSATAAPAVPGTSEHSLEIGGLTRTYLLHRPENLPPTAPLVVMLHGGFGSAAQAQRSYGWDEQADAAGFVVAYPDRFDRAWNTEGGDCCGIPARRGIDDVAFISAMVADIAQQLPIDTGRIYATGISNGGIMAYTLACRTDLFAAIAPDAATQLADCAAPHPLSVLHLHGAADTVIRYDGQPGHNIVTVIDGPPVPAVNEYWRQVDGCEAPATSTVGAVTTTRSTCPQGRTVELITIDGAGHQWPGARPQPLAERVLHTDPPATELDATAVIWQFFAAHPK